MKNRSLRSLARRLLVRWGWPAGIMIVLLALTIAISPLSQAEPPKDAPAAGPPKGIPVEGAQVIVAPASRAVTAVGTLQSNESVVIAAEIAGRVAEIGFAEGERVPAGKVLVRLDQSVLAAERDRAKASLGLSEANIRRAEILLKDQAIAERERDEAYARWQLDEASLRLAEAQLAKTTIRAPFEGLIGLRKVSQGGYLKAGDAVVTLDDIDPIKVDFRVPEVYAEQLRVGQPVALTLDAIPGRSFTGKVYAIDPQVDANGRSVLLRARVANDKGVLRPGMFARIALELEKRAEALMIPEEALIAQGDRQMVFRVTDGKVESVAVKIGVRSKALVEVVEGLRAGDTVITAGQIKVRPGMAVTVLPATPSAPKNGG